MEPCANLSAPIVARDLGTAQAQRRLTAHGNEMFALTTMETAVFDSAPLVRLTTPEPLADEVSIGGRIVTRTERVKPLPMLGKDLFEDIPADNDFGSHGSPSRWGVGVA
jgi:hypothetical protein